MPLFNFKVVILFRFINWADKHFKCSTYLIQLACYIYFKKIVQCKCGLSGEDNTYRDLWSQLV